MAGVLGVNATFKWKTVDISPGLTDVKQTRTVKTKATGTFGVLDETFVEAQRDTKLTVAYLFDKNASAIDAAAYNAVGGGPGAYEYYPESSGAGASNVKYSGNAILTKHEDNSKWDDLVKGTADFQVSGALARAVIA